MGRKKKYQRRYRIYREKVMGGVGKPGPLPRRSYVAKESAIAKMRLLIWEEFPDDLLSVVDEWRGKQVAALKKREHSIVEW